MIENCLFGVDINPNSVKICRLRLWIELLKHSYYLPPPIEGSGKLETLPNIDINIKCGNSLINRFDLYENYAILFPATQQKLRLATQKYKEQVILYKSVKDKGEKKIVRETIDRIKSEFAEINNPKDKDYQDWKIAEDKRKEHSTSIRFDTDKDSWGQQLKQLQDEENLLFEKYENKIKVFYSNAFEWKFEFPEVLDDNGNFIGFDIVIGNPPYIQLQKNKRVYEGFGYETFDPKGDIYQLFYEQGFVLSPPTNGCEQITGKV